jgi:hypothetical protein
VVVGPPALVRAGAAHAGVAGVGLNSSDSLDYTTDPKQIELLSAIDRPAASVAIWRTSMCEPLEISWNK